jgi:hypothetical protein
MRQLDLSIFLLAIFTFFEYFPPWFLTFNKGAKTMKLRSFVYGTCLVSLLAGSSVFAQTPAEKIKAKAMAKAEAAKKKEAENKAVQAKKATQAAAPVAEQEPVAEQAPVAVDSAAEAAKHALHVAKIARLKEIASETANQELMTKVAKLTDLENQRYAKVSAKAGAES